MQFAKIVNGITENRKSLQLQLTNFPNLFHSRECGERPAADNLLIQIRKLRGNHRRDLALHLNVSFHSCVRRVRKREGKKKCFYPLIPDSSLFHKQAAKNNSSVYF